MEDGGVGNSPEQVQAEIQAHMQGLTLPEWPVFTLGDAGWLAGVGQDERGTVCVRLDHRPPGAAQRLIVQTQPDPGEPVSLAYVLSQLHGPDGGEPLTLAGSAPGGTPTEVLIDDRPTPALMRSDGATAAWSVSVHGVLVIVAARSVLLDRPALTRVTDLAPLQHRRALEVERYLSQHPPT
jgi:hypothetical protein